MKKIINASGLLLVGIILGAGIILLTASPKTSPQKSETIPSEQSWSCSMHPQILQSEPGSCPICGMDLTPIVSGTDGLKNGQFQLSETALALANIQTTLVRTPQSKHYPMTLSGVLVENTTTQTVQTSYFSGVIEQLNINEVGQRVKKGQLLAMLYAPELIAAQQELLTASALKSEQPELYKAVKNKLRLLKLTEAEIQNLENSSAVVDYFPINATVSGRVINKNITEGQTVKAGQTLFELADLKSIWAVFDVYESQISSFRVGQSVRLKVAGLPSWNPTATVSFIDPVINPETRTAGLRVELNNADEQLKPGMFVEGIVDIPVNNEINESKTLLVPAAALLWTGKRSLVYVHPDPEHPVFEMREVILGAKKGSYYEIVAGLKEGESVVINGTFTLDAAAQLKGVPSMMNRSDIKTVTHNYSHDHSHNH